MVNKRAQITWSVMLVVLFAMLTAFGYYTYTGTVVHLSQDGTGKQAIMPQIRVVESMAGGKRIVVAYLSLINSGAQRLKIVDTVALTPLYDVQLRVKATGRETMDLATPTSQNLSSLRGAATNKNLFDPQNDAIVDLIPGSALTRTVNLSSLYDTQHEGAYELKLTYQPEIVTKSSSEMALVGAYTQRMICTYSFTLPIKKPEPPPEAIKVKPAKGPGVGVETTE